jgi:hypothetical protein
MKMLILAVLLTIMQASPSVPRKAANANTGKRQTVQSNADDNKKPTKDAASVVQTVRAQPNENANPAKSTENTEKSVSISELPSVSIMRDWMDCIALVFSGALLIVGIFGVRAAYRTLKKIDEQARVMRDQLTAMKGQISAAERATDLVISKERARISMDQPKPLILNYAGPNGVDYRLQFSGVTDANVLESKAVVGISSSADSKPTDVVFIPRILKLPNQVNPLILQTLDATAHFQPDILLTQADMNDIKAQKKFVHFWGFIRFRDAFYDVLLKDRLFEFQWVWTLYTLQGLGYDEWRGYWKGEAKEAEKPN